MKCCFELVFNALKKCVPKILLILIFSNFEKLIEPQKKILISKKLHQNSFFFLSKVETKNNTVIIIIIIL